MCFTPQEYLSQEIPAPHTAVVIDVLRATTSMVTAMANNCLQIIPAATVEEALAAKERYPKALLAGERQALIIPGFDLGNSPGEYGPETVADKTIIMTTTNGTLALKAASRAAKVYVGAMANMGAVSRKLAAEEQDVVLICAGTDGRFSLEDMLCAGLCGQQLTGKAVLGDSVIAARGLFREFQRSGLKKQMLGSAHASFLASQGFLKDVEYCLQIDILAIVPEYCQGAIRR